MAGIILEQPPKQGSSPLQWDAWIQKAWLYMKQIASWELVSETSGDADATVSASVSYHGVTALTAPRTKSLPAASSVPENRMIIIQDESGAAGAHTITVQRQGSDTVNGATSATITTNYGRLTVIKRNGKYFAK